MGGNFGSLIAAESREKRRLCWDGNATVTTTGVVTGIAAGVDTVIYTVSNAWCTAVADLPIKIISLSDCISLSAPVMPNNGTGDELSIKPNPSQGDITVSSSRNGTIGVFNVQGQRVAEYAIKAGDNKLELPAVMDNGVYLVEFTDQTGAVRVLKLVITR